MALDWTRPVYAQGKRGEVREDCPITGKKRVFFAHPRAGTVDGTVYRYGDDGICRTDGKPGPMDLTNEPATKAA